MFIYESDSRILQLNSHTYNFRAHKHLFGGLILCEWNCTGVLELSVIAFEKDSEIRLCFKHLSASAITSASK